MRRAWGWILLAAWVFVGGLWVAITIIMWRVNPVDDVDYAPARRLAALSFVIWLAVGGLIATLVGLVSMRSHRRASKPAPEPGAN